MIKEYKDFLDYNDAKEIEKAALLPRWTFLHGSNDDTALFWKLELKPETDSYFYTTLLQKIQNTIDEKIDKVERVYFNGHNACGSGSFHQDSNCEKGRTFLIYCNPVWNVTWGGATVFQEEHDIVHINPTPKKGVYFNNKMYHSALPIHKDFNGVRITLAYKLFVK